MEPYRCSACNSRMIIKQAKVKTTQEEVLQGILQFWILYLLAMSLCYISVVVPVRCYQALTEGKTDPVFLAVMAGRDVDKRKLPDRTLFREGYVATEEK